MGFGRGTIIKSFIWKLLERSSVQLISFIVTICLARILTPEDYGIVALVVIFIALADVIIDGGLNTALIQKKDSDNRDFSTIFFFSLFVSLILYCVMYLIAPIIASFYKQPQLISVIRVLSISFVFYSIKSIQVAYIARNMLFNKLFYGSLGAVIISGGIGILMAYKGYGVWALVFQSIISQIVTVIILWFTIKWRPDFVFSKKRFLKLFDYGWKIFISNFIITLFIKCRILLIGVFYTPKTLAFFERGEHFPSLIMGNINGSLQTILFPTFSAEQDNRVKVKSMMRRAMATSCLFIDPMMIGLIVIAKPLVLLLLTEKWLPVVPFLQIFCIANLFKPITLTNLEAIKSLGYSGIALKLEIIKKIVDIVILSVSIFLGVYAIAWGVVLYDFLCLFINLYPSIKLLNYKITEQLRDTFPSLLVSLIMGVIVYWIQFLKLNNLIILGTQIICGVCIYVLICYLFKIESFHYILAILKNHAMKKFHSYTNM